MNDGMNEDYYNWDNYIWPRRMMNKELEKMLQDVSELNMTKSEVNASVTLAQLEQDNKELKQRVSDCESELLELKEVLDRILYATKQTLS